MLGKITKNDQHFTVTMERMYPHAVEKVWAYLTENDKLQQWFPELAVESLQVDGRITFDMGDGSFEEMKILSLEPRRLLEFTWDRDVVAFELEQTAEGCIVVFVEKLSTIMDHTPRDLAGWHICLDAIYTLLDGKELVDDKSEWKGLYEQYREALRPFA